MKFWDDLSPAHKKWAVIAAMATFIVGIALATDDKGKRAVKKNPKENLVENVLTTRDTREVGLNNLAAQISHLQKSLHDMNGSLDKNDRRLDRLETKQINPVSIERQVAQMAAEVAKLNGTIKEKSEGLADAQHQIQQLRAQVTDIYTKPNTENGQLLIDGSQIPKSPESQTNGNPVQAQQEVISKDPKVREFESQFDQSLLPKPPGDKEGGESQEIPYALSEIAFADVTQESLIPESEKESSKTSAKDEDENKLQIPMGSILSGKLINGLDAPTGQAARKDPFPVVLRVRKEALLPNYYTADIRDCHVILSGYGDLSTERVMLRLEGVSCVSEDGFVMESKAEGYATGSDGKAGVRGRLVSRSGQMIANSILAGSLSGFASAFGQVPIPVVNTNPSQGQQQIDYASQLTTAGVNNGLMKGAQSGLERVADYFLDVAESIFPILELDAQREIDIILTRGISLPLPSRGRG